MKVRRLMVVECDVSSMEQAEGESQVKLDAFREAVQPNEYGVSLYFATHDDLLEFARWKALLPPQPIPVNAVPADPRQVALDRLAIDRLEAANAALENEDFAPNRLVEAKPWYRARCPVTNRAYFVCNLITVTPAGEIQLYDFTVVFGPETAEIIQLVRTAVT